MYTRRAWIIGVGSLGASALWPAGRGFDWPQFRGPDRTNISKETGLLRKWPANGPKRLWSVAGGTRLCRRRHRRRARLPPRLRRQNIRVDGQLPLSRRRASRSGSSAKPREIRPNHAITRTVPAVDGRFVISLDPKAVLHCLDAKTGKQIWRKSLVTEYKATIPSWYNGQNPLQEADRVIVATGGAAIMVALDKATGKEIWRTPNPGPTPDVARLRDAGSAGRSQAVSLRNARTVRWEFPRRMASCCGRSPASLTWR